MKPRFLMSAIFFACVLSCAGTWASVPGPQDPLSFQDSGLYGGISNYFATPSTPFDFYVVQGVVYQGQNDSAFASWLKTVRQNGGRVIVDLIPQVPNGSGGYYGVS